MAKDYNLICVLNKKGFCLSRENLGVTCSKITCPYDFSSFDDIKGISFYKKIHRIFLWFSLFYFISAGVFMWWGMIIPTIVFVIFGLVLLNITLSFFILYKMAKTNHISYMGGLDNKIFKKKV